MSRSYDVVIVGAGIVGAACAEECARRGLRVAIVEADFVASGATAAAMGHIVVMDDSEAQFALTRYSQQLWHARRSELPADVEFEQCGTIWVAPGEEEMVEARRKQAQFLERGVPAQLLTPEELERLEPKLRRGVAGGLLVPEDAVLYPPCAARFILDRAQMNGAKLFLGVPASRIRGGYVQLANGLELSGSTVVNAAGAAAPLLSPGLEVKKRKGHLVITDRYPGMVRHQLVELGYVASVHATSLDTVAFNVQPRKTGQVLIGSSRQYEVETKDVDHVILGRMLQRAAHFMPQLGRLSAIRVWTGFRAATADRLPLIGWDPSDQNVYVATGHEGLGITTSLGTAKLFVDELTGKIPQIPSAPYSPARISISVHAHA
ncbi:MAG: FAD-dependent oxidoreductase [Acidobacteria bacterium]|nr:FAD-dependent oxidoreductase [Acidobacteriota bacterium]